MNVGQFYSILLNMIGIIAGGDPVSLSLSRHTIPYGGDIILTCTVHGITTIDITTTRQWSMGDNDKLLCYNGRINNLRKYKEKVLPGNEFSLTIFNVTESDLNVVYQCRYGFDAASKLIGADEPKIVLSLILVTNFIVFGGDITLTCTVDGISAINKEVTRQWSMGNDDELLCYNSRINNPRKYEETVISRNRFSLKILKITEEDVNITYRCRYGFDAASTFIELSEYNYVIPPTQESMTTRYVLEKQTDTINISIYFKSVFPLPNCSLNIEASNFHITDFSEHDVDMEVNLSLSLQRTVACSRSFILYCHVARRKYEVGYLKLKDECSSKDKLDTVIFISITSITIGLLIIGLVKSKRFVLEERKYQLKANYSNLCNLKIEQPDESKV